VSRIDELIRDAAPNGVEFKTLGDVAKTLSGLSGKSKADFSDGNARYVPYQNVFSNLAVNQGAFDCVKVGPGEKQNRIREGDIIFTSSSETADEVGMSAVVMSEPSEPLYLNSFCFIVRFDDPQMLLPSFAKYLFRSDSLRLQIQRTASGVTRINISKDRFMKIRIPLPTLQIQRDIARILDHFTELEAELEAEMEDRRRQHAFHWASLLTPSDGWRPTTLGKVAEVFDGPHATPRKTAVGPWYLSISSLKNGRFDLTESAHLGEDEFHTWTRRVAPRVGDTMFSYETRVGQAAYWDRDEPAALGRRMGLLRPREAVVDPRFLTLLYLGPQMQTLIEAKTVRGSTVERIPIANMAAWEISIPPLPEQKRIVDLLDKFDTLANDLSIGIPAELNARRKQYEYYRDRLMSFEDAAA
jgi:type I restriction enzyme, S subunit